MTQALVGMDLGDLQTILGSDQPKFRARQIYDALYRQKAARLDDITTLPRDLKSRLAVDYHVGLPETAARYDSTDGTALATCSNSTTTVRWKPSSCPEGERNTLCISSQVGCPVNCRFCLTALMGLERNLTAGEIVGQVLHVIAANQLSAGSDPLNIVMMGQGEPLLNLPNVVKATRILTDKEGLAFAERRITVSTSGIIPKIEELGRESVRPKLAISLNASNEEQREELMPITRKYHLRDLMAACKAYPLRSWEKLTFEYVLLAGVNDSDADARRGGETPGQPQRQGESDRAQPGSRHSLRHAGRRTRRVPSRQSCAAAFRVFYASRAVAMSTPPAVS